LVEFAEKKVTLCGSTYKCEEEWSSLSQKLDLNWQTYICKII
jgi:hypothetical protein